MTFSPINAAQPYYDRQYNARVLVYGKVLAQGTAEQIRNDARVQAVYLGQEEDETEPKEEGAA